MSLPGRKDLVFEARQDKQGITPQDLRSLSQGLRNPKPYRRKSLRMSQASAGKAAAAALSFRTVTAMLELGVNLGSRPKAQEPNTSGTTGAAASPRSTFRNRWLLTQSHSPSPSPYLRQSTLAGPCEAVQPCNRLVSQDGGATQQDVGAALQLVEKLVTEACEARFRARRCKGVR